MSEAEKRARFDRMVRALRMDLHHCALWPCGQDIAFDGLRAHLVALPSGSAAMIAPGGQPLDGLEHLVRTSLLPLRTGA